MHQGMRGRWSTWIEGGVLAAEIVLLASFSIPVWSARVDAFPSEQQSTSVRVVAEQFAWNVHYPGADRRFGRTDPRLLGPANPLGLDRSGPAAQDDITTINQLHLPVNRPVIVHLSSKDMIHSFALPQMRVKQDAIPGIAQPVWFTPTQTGARGDCLLTALRPWPLPHAGLLHDSHGGGIRGLVGGGSRAARRTLVWRALFTTP